MVDEPTSPPAAGGRILRVAARLMRLGVPGTIAAVLLLRALAPLSLLPLNSFKLLPLAMVCCAEVGWLFGGSVGLLLAAQWLLHELAHVHAAQRIGLTPGWRSFIPLVGVYSGTTPSAFGSRENEALVALAGVLTGLVAAAALLAAGVLLDSPAMALAARLGFALTLINLLPFRPFDGGRIFPGCLWRYRADGEASADGDAASRRFLAGCRSVDRFLSARGAAPKETRTMLADLIHWLFYGIGAASAAAYLVLPPIVFALTLMAGFAAVWLFLGALLSLDPKAVAAPVEGRVQPRYPRAPAAGARADLPWRDRAAALASLGIYGAAVAAALAGALA